MENYFKEQDVCIKFSIWNLFTKCEAFWYIFMQHTLLYTSDKDTMKWTMCLKFNTTNSASTKILSSNKMNSTVKSLWAKILDYLCNAKNKTSKF